MHLTLLAVLLTATPLSRPLVAQATPSDAPPPPPSESSVSPYQPKAEAPKPPPAAPDLAQNADAPLPFDAAEKPEEQPGLRLLGAQLSAGAPDGIVLSAVVRPVKWVRGTVGLAHNVLGLGVQGSVTAIPFHWAVTPTFTLTAGKFFDSDVARYADDLDLPRAFEPPLRDFSYSFYSAQLGLEFGSQNAFTFALRGGLARVTSDLKGIRGFQPEGQTDTTIDVSNLDVSATVPTVNLSFAYYIW